jgi:hypothetical protein
MAYGETIPSRKLAGANRIREMSTDLTSRVALDTEINSRKISFVNAENAIATAANSMINANGRSCGRLSAR